MRTEALDYDLPEALIATQPAEPRDQARLLLVKRQAQKLEHHRVADLPDLGLFTPGDLMLVNQTRVLPAQLTGVRLSTGGRVSGLFVESDAQRRWTVLIESRGSLKPEETIELSLDHDPVVRPATIQLL